MINEFWVAEKRKEMHMYAEALKPTEAGSMFS